MLGIKRTRPIRVAAAKFEGKPDDVPGQFEKLYAWARRLGLRTGDRDSSGRMNLPWTACFHDTEATAASADVPRPIDVWIPLDGAGPTQGEFTVIDVDHENVAFMIHKGPMSRFEESVQTLFTWAKSKQLQFRERDHRRIYLRGIDTHPEDPDWEAEIQIPITASRSN